MREKMHLHWPSLCLYLLLLDEKKNNAILQVLANYEMIEHGCLVSRDVQF